MIFSSTTIKFGGNKMAQATAEEKQAEHNRGERDASEGRREERWCLPFESYEHYDDLREAYEAGRDNAFKQMK